MEKVFKVNVKSEVISIEEWLNKLSENTTIFKRGEMLICQESGEFIVYCEEAEAEDEDEMSKICKMNLKQFAPKDLCIKLLKFGCVSHMDFIWQACSDSTWKVIPYEEHPMGTEFVPAFSKSDFMGKNQQARENLKLIFEEESVLAACEVGDYSWEYLEEIINRKINNED